MTLSSLLLKPSPHLLRHPNNTEERMTLSCSYDWLLRIKTFVISDGEDSTQTFGVSVTGDERQYPVPLPSSLLGGRPGAQTNMRVGLKLCLDRLFLFCRQACLSLLQEAKTVFFITSFKANLLIETHTHTHLTGIPRML